MRRIGTWLAVVVAMAAVSLMLMGGLASANGGPDSSDSTGERLGDRVLRIQTEEDGSGSGEGPGRRPCSKRDGGSNEGGGGGGSTPRPSPGGSNTSV